jgi:hypothetical protein
LEKTIHKGHIEGVLEELIPEGFLTSNMQMILLL